MEWGGAQKENKERCGRGGGGRGRERIQNMEILFNKAIAPFEAV